MGRHQLELAVAFFLLGGDTYSALSVCVKNLGDEQLALVICRLVEGHGGPLQHHLITKFLLPSAIEKGDYWLASLLEVRGICIYHLFKKAILVISCMYRSSWFWWCHILLEPVLDLQWELGNYLQSFCIMLGFQINPVTEKSALLSKHVAFLDPNIGLYCLALATRNSMRNAVGEKNTAVLVRWATLMTVIALKRCGLPVSSIYSSCNCNMGLYVWNGT